MSPITRHSREYPLIVPERHRTALQDRTVIVTGAGRGIGKSIAVGFAKAGANVVCIARSRVEVQETVSFITQHHPRAQSLALSVDVTCAASVYQAVKTITARFGTVDVLVNNAAVDWISPFESEASLDRWWRVMEVNLKGPLTMVHAVLPQMLAARSGVIISICSRNATFNLPFMTAYSTSKTALLRFHQCLDLEIRDRNIYSYVVQPGDVDTTLSKGPDAVNIDAAALRPEMQSLLDIIEQKPCDDPDLAAGTCVALAAGGALTRLSGLYIDAQQDLGEVLHHLDENTLHSKALFTLKLDTL